MTKATQYFLATNSANGFYSVYEDLIESPDEKIYIIKSGPGSGKSTLMKTAAENIAKRGEPVEYVYCSGDPDSLDAVRFPSLGAVIVDGTPPHVIEPRHIHMDDRYVDFTDVYKGKISKTAAENIVKYTASYKDAYKRAYLYLEKYGIVHGASDIGADFADGALRKKVLSVMHKYKIKGGEGGGRTLRRFACAFTNSGVIEKQSELKKYKTAVILDSKCGLESRALKILARQAESEGFDAVLYLDPLFPERLSHVAVPEKEIIFLGGGTLVSRDINTEKTVRLDRVLPKEYVSFYKKLRKMTSSAENKLLAAAQAELKCAKHFHDLLEGEYNPYIDFDAVGKKALFVTDLILSSGK